MLMFLNEQHDLSQAIEGSYNLVLVLLSYVIACIASNTALSMADRYRESEEEAKGLWLVAGALSLGLGIWAMHFVGMLAFQLPVAVSYEIITTLISIIPAVLASIIVIKQLSIRESSHRQLLTCGVYMGAGIGGMHYIGMGAMQLNATMAYEPVLFLLSIIIAITLATLALYTKVFDFEYEQSNSKLLFRFISSLLMGAAIAGMHYTGMWSVYFFPVETTTQPNLVLPPTPLGILVTLASLLVLLAARISSAAGAQIAITKAHMQAKDSAEKLKDQFISTVTHELLTPLHGINLSLSLIMQDKGKHLDEYIKMARNSAEHMQELVNSMIIFTEARRGGLKLDPSAFRVRNCMDKLSQIKAGMLHKYVEMNFVCEDKVPTWIYVDENKLVCVLVQLIRNAMKFTERGEIKVLCTVDSENQLVFSVSDTGLGMDKETCTKVLDEFYQGDSSDSRRYGGLGIGLNIVKDVLKTMDGKLSLSSTLGSGSTFKITLPLTVPNQEQLHRAIADEEKTNYENGKQASNPTVLVVEDNPTNMMLLVKMLEQANFNVLSAANGQEAVEVVKNSIGIDVVLMDCQMPVMDGFAATQQIREQFTAEQLPIIAISANISDIDKARCQKAGMNDFLPKPIRNEALQSSLCHWLVHRAS